MVPSLLLCSFGVLVLLLGTLLLLGTPRRLPHLLGVPRGEHHRRLGAAVALLGGSALAVGYLLLLGVGAPDSEGTFEMVSLAWALFVLLTIHLVRRLLLGFAPPEEAG